MQFARWINPRLHLCLALSFWLVGCTSLDTYNRSRPITPGLGGATYIDAKQRAVFTVPSPTTVNGVTAWQTRICAEPSPDALSALAASGSGALSFAQKASAQAAFSLSETANNIGLRTQSIQLMRDAMYRLCEGVASGSLDSVQFETLYRHFQNSMVTILAIEQLTGVVRPGSAQLSTNASAGSTKDVADLTASAAKAQSASADADATATEKKNDLDKANATAAAYLKANGAASESALTDEQKTDYAKLKQAVADATAASATADSAAATAKENLAIYTAGMKAIGLGDLSASGTATVSGGSGSAPTGDAAAAIATAVENIVKEQTEVGFFRETCATLFVDQISHAGNAAAAAKDSLESNCSAYAQATIADVTARAHIDEAIASSITKAAEAGHAFTPPELANLIDWSKPAAAMLELHHSSIDNPTLNEAMGISATRHAAKHKRPK